MIYYQEQEFQLLIQVLNFYKNMKTKKTKKKEILFINEKVNIYKIKDSPGIEKELENIKAGEEDKLLKLSYFHSTKKNVIPMVGRQQICKVLAGEAEISIYDSLAETFPNISAIGTSDAVPTENSTKLTNEVFRKYVQSRSYDQNNLWVMSRYLPTDCEGEFREEAIFLQGNKDIKDSGIPISIINLTPAEGDKTDSEYLIIDRKFILNI